MLNTFLITTFIIITTSQNLMAISSRPKITVETASPHYPKEKLDPDLYDTAVKKHASNIPIPEKSEKIFVAADIVNETANLDQLDKDILIMRAKKYKFKRLKKYYPNITEKKLIELQKLVK